jgi:CHAD domain-containing protein
MPSKATERSSVETAHQLAECAVGGLHRVMLSHAPGALSGDVGAIHDMRVTVRRLRVALSNFATCFDPAGCKLMRAKLSDLADALGAVRDLDVFIATLDSRKAKLSTEHPPHLQSFIGRLRARRRRRARRLAEYLRGADYAQVRDQFLTAIELRRSESEAHQTGEGTREANGQAA